MHRVGGDGYFTFGNWKCIVHVISLRRWSNFWFIDVAMLTSLLLVTRCGVHSVVTASVLLINSASVLTSNRLPVRAYEAVFKCQFVMEDSSSVSDHHLIRVCSKEYTDHRVKWDLVTGGSDWWDFRLWIWHFTSSGMCCHVYGHVHFAVPVFTVFQEDGWSF